MKSIIAWAGVVAWVMVVGSACVRGEETEKTEKKEVSEKEALEIGKKAKDQIDQVLKIKLATHESKHFLVHSDTPTFERKKVLKDGETVYKKLSDIFHIEEETALWPGKYVVILFKDRQEFTDYWYKVRNHRGELSGSSGTGFGSGVVGYVANSRPGSCSDQTGSFYFHIAGRFLVKYKEGKGLPSWVGMGFTIYCCNVLARDRDGANRARQDVKEAIKAGDRRSLKVIRETKSWPATDGKGRNLCFSLVDYMISIDQKKFVQFVECLKQGTTEDQALQDAFGISSEQFEKGWTAYIEAKY